MLNLQESPPASGLFSVHEDSSYSATALANGASWLLNAETSDKLTVHVRTTVTANSYPHIRVSNSGGSSLLDLQGSPDGVAVIENFAFPAPGAYTITVYSNNGPSAFTFDALFGRGVALETEDNNFRRLSQGLLINPQGGGFTTAVAGVLDRDEDWFDLGALAPGNTVNFSAETPAISTLQASAIELALFRDDEPAARATATGVSLVHNVTTAGRYRVRVRMPGPEGKYLQFGGADSISLGNPEALKITGSQTIGFWINPDDFGQRRNPVSKAYGGEGSITIETDGRMNYYYGANGGNGGSYQGFNSGAVLQSGRWQHVALVRDLGSVPMQLRWYFDGQLVAQTTANYPAAAAGSLDFLVGSGFANTYRGGMDELRV